MLVSVSNHPPDGWAPDQRAAAAPYGDVRHLPFPDVPPHADAATVEALADALAAGVLAALPPPAPDGRPSHGPHAAFVAGEATLAFALVARLQRDGLPCLAATTERHIEQLPDGATRRTFAFVRFREYPPLDPASTRSAPREATHPAAPAPPDPSTDDPGPLPVTALHVELACHDDLALPPFAGFALYGALKQRARERGCRWNPACAARCARPADCAFGRLFQPPGTDRQRRGPLPLVLHLAEPRRVGWRRGETLRAELRVLGPHPEPALDLLRHALDAVAAHGLGVAGHPPATVSVAQAEARPLDPPGHPDAGPLTVAFDTPLRLRRRGAWVSADDLDADALLRGAHHRERTLRDALGLPPAPPPDPGLADRLCRTAADLRWQTFRRPSKTGGHSASGLVGTATFDGDPADVAALARRLARTARLHLGAKTAMGLGALRFQGS